MDPLVVLLNSHLKPARDGRDHLEVAVARVPHRHLHGGLAVRSPGLRVRACRRQTVAQSDRTDGLAVRQSDSRTVRRPRSQTGQTVTQSDRTHSQTVAQSDRSRSQTGRAVRRVRRVAQSDGSRRRSDSRAVRQSHSRAVAPGLRGRVERGGVRSRTNRGYIEAVDSAIDSRQIGA
eukprot:9182052-Pyramimonas_sp.AAC.1